MGAYLAVEAGALTHEVALWDAVTEKEQRD
jgi:hypothetical protein